MTENKSSYYANVTERNESIHISEGGKPFFKGGFSRYIEVYLPKSYHENLTVTSTNGDIDFSDMSIDSSMLRIDNSSGNVTLDNAVGSDSGVVGNNPTVTVKVETNNGDIEVTQ
ncbi:putative adhesin [Muricomes intestini]|uniref:Putative adhesin n=2 Tax=Muricomes intestini TaxID=1796634 RepID=A0A4R3K2Q6_9FIRM|nr:DUF4097 family beta strand repeat-containing protein [Muricomes intestini]TCS76705.1 putative adhesin [Muricomes intestini]